MTAQADDSTAPAGRQHPAGRLARLGAGARLVVDIAILLVVAVLALAPGLTTLPVTDRDEARFVQATRQMVETGDWIDIRFQDEPRYKKPIGIYWLQGAAVVASGQGAEASIWVYRLPSLAAAILSVLLVYAIGRTLGGATAGLVAALLAAVTIQFGFEARIAKTDSVLLFTVLAAQWALASLWMDPSRKRAFVRNAVFWTAIGLGILIKGPVILLVTGTTLAVLLVVERSTALLRALSPVWGLLWAVAIVAPWLVAIGIISKGAFFSQSLGEDMLAKVASGQESHGAPPGVHALVALGTFWPLSALIPAAIAYVIAKRREKGSVFLAAWVLPGWIVFEAVATKLPNYVLPFMPAFAIGVGLAFVGGALAAGSLWRKATYLFVALGGLVLAVGLNAGFVHYERYASIPGLLVGLAAAGAAVAASMALVRGRTGLGIAATCLAGALSLGNGLAVILPGAESLWLSNRLADAVDRVKTCPDPVVISVGYAEPSVIFLNGTNTVLADPQTAVQRFGAASCAVLSVENRSVEATAAALGAAGITATPASTVEGRNFNGLRPRTLQLYVKP